MNARRGLELNIVVLSLGLLPAGCDSRTQADDQDTRPGAGFRRTSLLRAVAWRTNLKGPVIQRVDAWVADDVVQTMCEGTGLYVVDSLERTTAWHSGQPLCDVLAQSHTVDLDDGNALLYADRFDKGGIYRLDLETSRKTLLFDRCLPPTSSPAWSPDGRVVAFVANCVDREHAFLHVMNSDGSGVRAVEPAQSRNIREDGPSWAPDGREIALVQNIGMQNLQIVIADISTGTRRVVVAGGRAPAWSPTGEWIAYLTHDSAGITSSAVGVVSRDGSPARLLFSPSESSPVSQVAGALVWSPDGRSIAFGRVYQGRSTVWTVGVDGTRLHQLVGPQE